MCTNSYPHLGHVCCNIVLKSLVYTPWVYSIKRLEVGDIYIFNFPYLGEIFGDEMLKYFFAGGRVPVFLRGHYGESRPLKNQSENRTKYLC